jgi:hypothetical protein
MSEPPVETHRLSYAPPETPPAYSPGWVTLLIVNALAALVSLWFLQLARHIYSCTESEKWCHLHALILGLPFGFFLLVLMLITASMSHPAHPAPDRSVRVKVTAWSLLAFAIAVVVSLIAAIEHNSK